MNTGLDGRCAIVTGAARGQGATHARALLTEGARVLLADVLDEPGRDLASELGDDAEYQHLDITDEAQWAAALVAAEHRFGPVRVLVNNAGILRRGRLENTTQEHFDTTMAVNVRGAFLGMRAVVPPMRAAGGGSIVNIASNAGFLGTAGALAYVTSKWAMRGMSRAAAAELGQYGIRVNSVYPGSVATPLLLGDGFDEAAFLERGRFRLALPRIAESDEISPAVVYFASDLSGYATGSELVVDGGWAIG